MVCFLIYIVQPLRGSSVKYLGTPSMSSWSTRKTVVETDQCRNSCPLCFLLGFLKHLGPLLV